MKFSLRILPSARLGILFVRVSSNHEFPERIASSTPDKLTQRVQLWSYRLS